MRNKEYKMKFWALVVYLLGWFLTPIFGCISDLAGALCLVISGFLFLALYVEAEC